MADYTKVNIMGIEPGDPDGPVQLRFSRSKIDSKDLGVTHSKYAPNYKSKRGHSHKVQEEVYLVIAGSGRALLNDKVEKLEQWDVLRVAPKTMRAFEAGPDGLEMVIAGGPKPPEGDGQMSEVTWPE